MQYFKKQERNITETYRLKRIKTHINLVDLILNLMLINWEKIMIQSRELQH